MAQVHHQVHHARRKISMHELYLVQKKENINRIVSFSNQIGSCMYASCARGSENVWRLRKETQKGCGEKVTDGIDRFLYFLQHSQKSSKIFCSTWCYRQEHQIHGDKTQVNDKKNAIHLTGQVKNAYGTKVQDMEMYTNHYWKTARVCGSRQDAMSGLRGLWG